MLVSPLLKGSAMSLKPISLPIIATAFAASFASPAAAICIYATNGGETLQSQNDNYDNELLGDAIPFTLEELPLDIADDIGETLNFECFYRRDLETREIIGLRYDNPFTPRNIDHIPAIDRLTNQYSISFHMEANAQGPLMDARVTCDNIEITFQPKRHLDRDVPYSEAVQNFQETMLNILGQIAQRPGNAVTGYYQIQETLGTVVYVPDQKPLTCTAAVS